MWKSDGWWESPCHFSFICALSFNRLIERAPTASNGNVERQQKGTRRDGKNYDKWQALIYVTLVLDLEKEKKKLSYLSNSVIELKGKFHRSYYEIEYRNYGVKLEEHDDDALGSAGKFDGEEKWKVINFLSNWKNGFGFIDEGEIFWIAFFSSTELQVEHFELHEIEWACTRVGGKKEWNCKQIKHKRI